MKTNKKEKMKNKYCFPDIMARFMSKVDDRTQMEASLMSMFMLLIGMILVAAYMVLFMDFSWWFKTLTIINSLCAFVFLFSYLVTTFQQYQTLMETQELIGKFGSVEPFEITKSELNEMKGGRTEQDG